MAGIAALTPAAVFHTGDLVRNGRDKSDWDTFDSITSQLPPGTPIYPALGNHEHASSFYFDHFHLPGNERWYAVRDIPGLRFIVLDAGSAISPATSTAPASDQYSWLQRELSADASPDAWTVVIFHYPLYSTGHHGSDEKHLVSVLTPLFVKYGVDAVFSGHDHDYERLTVDGIRYIVTGGGGAPLRRQAGKSEYSEVFAKEYHFCVLYFDQEGKLMVDAWSDEAKLLDRFGIENR